MANPNISFLSNSYSYDLPEDKIAQEALEKRDESKMLLYEGGRLSHHQFKNLPALLKEQHCLVFNNTKVVHARLFFEKKSGARIEIFCLEPINSSLEEALTSKGASTWRCLIGNAKKWKEGSLHLGNGAGVLKATRKGKDEAGHIVHFSWTKSDASFADMLEDFGRMPLPPYIKRTAREDDEERYQTVLAQFEGAVAAPTASLHFSKPLLARINALNVESAELTLHVGAGTFKPVVSEDLRKHQMHPEEVIVSLDGLRDIHRWLSADKLPIAVGTTAMRSLESLYWLAVAQERGESRMEIDQNEPYRSESRLSTTEALEFLIKQLTENGQNSLRFKTSIMIRPGYEFKICKGLITNFHMPGSSLLFLVAAFLGDEWRLVYEEALAKGYRFLSYGDGSLLLP